MELKKKTEEVRKGRRGERRKEEKGRKGEERRGQACKMEQNFLWISNSIRNKVSVIL